MSCSSPPPWFFALLALLGGGCARNVLPAVTDAGPLLPPPSPSHHDGAAPPPPGGTLEWVVLVDLSAELNATGTPGADICGAAFVCPDGLSGEAVDFKYTPGSGELCTEAGIVVGGRTCATPRGDPSAALGPPESPCVGGSVPSEYVSLGVGGVLALKMGSATDPGAVTARGGLDGCTVTVSEAAGGRTPGEGYEVHVCRDADGLDCHPQSPLGRFETGGEGQVDVPAQ